MEVSAVQHALNRLHVAFCLGAVQSSTAESMV